MPRIISGFRVNSGKSLDEKYGPYNSLEEANNNIPLAERYNGLTFGVFTNPNDLVNSNVIEYFYTKDLSNNSIKMKYDIIVSDIEPENPSINVIWIQI